MEQRSVIGGLYRILSGFSAPFAAWHLHRRRARGKEHAVRWRERRGFSSLARPSGFVLWVHAASVGESLSVLPLLERLLEKHPDWHALVTTGTVASAELLDRRLPKRAFHQFVPLDVPGWVERFFDHWRPDAGLWMESEFWPNLLLEASRRSLPLCLLNGRVSERSFRAWSRWPKVSRLLLRSFELCLGQTEDDVRRLRLLGAERVEFLGNLKLASPALPASAEVLELLRRAFAGRPCWLAASTHAGEESAAWEVHRVVKRRHPHLLTVVVPRHADRGDRIRAELEAAGATIAQRSRGDLPTRTTEVYLADTMGELGLFYRLCPVVFIGKSLHGGGGQNPFEPARLGCAVFFGPQMQNFTDVARRMEALGAGRMIAGTEELAEAVAGLLTDSPARRAASAAALAFAMEEAEVLERVEARLSAFFRCAAAPCRLRTSSNEGLEQ